MLQASVSWHTQTRWDQSHHLIQPLALPFGGSPCDLTLLKEILRERHPEKQCLIHTHKAHSKCQIFYLYIRVFEIACKGMVFRAFSCTVLSFFFSGLFPFPCPPTLVLLLPSISPLLPSCQVVQWSLPFTLSTIETM